MACLAAAAHKTGISNPWNMILGLCMQQARVAACEQLDSWHVTQVCGADRDGPTTSCSDPLDTVYSK